jgi:hypothetical protein
LPCAFWPPAERREIRPYTAAGAPPIVVVSTKYDPATRYDWGVALADQLESGVLVSYEGYGHTSSGSCVTDIIAGYLVDLVVPASGTTCASEEDPFPAPELTEPTVVPTAPAPIPPTGIITPPDTGSGGANRSSSRHDPGFALVAATVLAAAAGLTVAARRFP